MAWTRRRWLALGLVATAAAASAGAWLRPGLLRRLRLRFKPIGPLEREMLARLVDLLVPADETPGALEFGVDRAILAQAARDPELADLLASGFLRLDADAQLHAGRSWLALSTPQQQLSLQQLAAGPPMGFPGRFFWRLRDDTLAGYYGNPKAWQRLSYHGPPQPAGYADYAEPPPGPAG